MPAISSDVEKPQDLECAMAAAALSDAHSSSHFRISVIAMTGAAIVIDDASTTDSILSVKRRVFAANRELPLHRQRLVYRPGPRGIDALADDETLGGAGVAQDGSAELDVLLEELTEAEKADLSARLLVTAKEDRCGELLELLDDGADIEVKDKEGCTPLIEAAANGHVDCARLLVNRGADKEAANVIGRTALLMAFENGRVECARLLLEAGADANAKDRDGHTCLIAAAAMCHQECVQLLLDAGVGMGVKDNNGQTAFDFAKKNDKHHIARMLEPIGLTPAASSALCLGASAPLATSKFDIVVVMLHGKSKTLHVENSESIDIVKNMIAYKEGFMENMRELLRLHFKGRHLDDDRTLADYDIQAMAVMHLVLRRRSG